MPRLFLPQVLLPLLVLTACSSSVTPLAQRCDVTLQAPEPPSGAPGALIAVMGTPLTTNYDTALYVGGLLVPVTELDRSTCESTQADGSPGCDQCREQESCLACGDCDDCDLICAQTCVESFTFSVPVLSPGSTTLWILNAHGQSNTVPFEILAPADTGSSGDSG